MHLCWIFVNIGNCKASSIIYKTCSYMYFIWITHAYFTFLHYLYFLLIAMFPYHHETFIDFIITTSPVNIYYFNKSGRYRIVCFQIYTTINWLIFICIKTRSLIVALIILKIIYFPFNLLLTFIKYLETINTCVCLILFSNN